MACRDEWSAMKGTPRLLLVPRGQMLATVAGAIVLYLASWWPMRGFVADDTYIHLTYARHVRDGHGLVFNLGEPVYGTTSPLWSLGLGLLGRTGVDLLLLSRLLSATFGLATVLLGSVVLHRLLSIWKDRHDLDPRLVGLAWVLGSLVWAIDVWLVRWSASGMESSLATFLVLAGFAADLGSDPPGSSARAPAWWWALASLVRPEACLLVGLLALRSALTPGSPSVRLREVAWALLPAALLGGSWLAYAAASYGSIVPTTLASKAAEGTPALQNLLVQAEELAADRGVEIIALLVVLPLLAGRLRHEWREHLVPVGWLLLLPLFYATSKVLGITRYVLVLVPVLVCYGWPALACLASRAGRGGRVALPRALMLGAGLAALGANAFVLFHQVVPQARAFERILEQSLIPMAKWFNAHTPPDTRVAVAHVGAFGYYSERRIVDLGGLVTPELGPLLARYQYERLVSEFRFATAVRPDYLIDVDTESRRMLTHSPYAPCLELLEERPFDYRSIRHPEPAFITAYRIDWDCFDARPPAPG